MTKQVVKFDTPELKVIEKSKAEQIKSTFEPMSKMLAEFEDQYNELMSIPIDDITIELTKQYNRLRIDIGKVRIATGKAKDKAKEYLKLEDKAIMGVHNILVWAVKEKEDKLKERENYFEIKEQKRLEALQIERAKKLSAYVEDAHERNLSRLANDEFDALLLMKKKEYNDRIEAEKKAEADRIAKEKAEAEERKKILIENERLKKEREELEAKQAAEAAEREKLAKIEAEKRLKAEEERIAAQKIIDDELRKQKEEAEAKAAAAQKIINDRLAAEQKAIKEEAERKRNLLLAGDKQILKDWVNAIMMPNIIESKLSKESETIKSDIEEKFKSFKSWAIKQVDKIN